MRTLNRSLLLVRPRKPYAEWANSLDDTSVRFVAEHNEPGAYLVPEIGGPEDLDAILEDAWAVIFESELEGWSRIESDWPKRRTRKMFEEWFEVLWTSMVLDLVGGKLKAE